MVWAPESIGTAVPTRVPELGSDGHIGEALRMYHYGPDELKQTGDSTVANDDGTDGLAGHILKINNTLTTLTGDKIGNDIFSAQGSLVVSDSGNLSTEFLKGTNGYALTATATSITWTDLSSIYYPLVGGKTISGNFDVVGTTTLTGTTTLAGTATISGLLSANDNVNVSNTGGDASLNLYAETGKAGLIGFYANSVRRWLAYMDSGTNYRILSYHDDASTHDALIIDRATEAITLYGDVTMNSDLSIGGTINGTVAFGNSVSFNGSITVPTPTLGQYAANKSYVDDTVVTVFSGTDTVAVAAPPNPSAGDLYCRYI